MAGQPGNGTVEIFVTNLYLELLGRQPDAAGSSFWASILNGGESRTQVATDFMLSQEYAIHFVTSVFQNFLHRAPDASGLSFWEGIYLSQRSELLLITFIVGSQEYYLDNGGTAKGFVNALYRDLLGRTADADGMAFWSGLVGTVPNEQIVLSFLLTNEGANKFTNGNYKALGGSVPNSPPGHPQTANFALAKVTGNGYDNLFFQGTMTQDEINAFITLLQSSGTPPRNDVNALIGLLASSKYFG